MLQRAVCLFFALFLATVAVWDATGESAFDWPARTADLLSARALESEADVVTALLPGLPPGSAFESFERDLEAASSVRRWLRPRVQRIWTRWLRLGNARVAMAPNDTLLHRPSFEHVVGPAFGSEPADTILRWRDALARRGVELLVVPVPAKASLLLGDTPRHNSGWNELAARLDEAGVPLLRIAPAYLRTDTHWTPEAMEEAAAAIADELVARGWVERGRRLYATTALGVERVGDLGRLLDERPTATWIRPDEVTIRAVAGWQPDLDSQVLLLGDSFTNIYSLSAMGWGQRAGLAEHLSVQLGFDVDRIALNGDGARASRDALRRSGPRRLASKRVVVFQFAARELSHGDWSALSGDPPP